MAASSRWLFAIAANQLRNRWGLQRTEQKRAEKAAAELVVAAPADPALEAEDKLHAETLRKAVAALPAELRDPVGLYYFAGLTVAETAKTLGLGVEAVKSRLFRARARLKATLDRGQPRGAEEGILQ